MELSWTGNRKSIELGYQFDRYQNIEEKTNGDAHELLTHATSKDTVQEIAAPRQSNFCQSCTTSLGISTHIIVLRLVKLFVLIHNWMPQWLMMKEGILGGLVWMALCARVFQNFAEIFVLSMDFYHSFLLLIGSLGFAAYQLFLVAKECIAYFRPKDSEFTEPYKRTIDMHRRLDTQCAEFSQHEWRRRLNAIQYARAMYENSIAGILFAYGTMLTPTSFFQTIQDIFSCLMEMLSLGSLTRRNFFEKEFPNKWQHACKHVHTFESRYGFAQYFNQNEKFGNMWGLFPPTTPIFTPVFTPLAVLYRDSVFDERKKSVLVLAIRGSTSLRDFFVDLNCWITSCDRMYLFRRDGFSDHKVEDKCGRNDEVHIGIYAASVDLFLRTESRIRDEIAKGHVDELVITGHSLGGAVAVYLTDLFKEHLDEDIKITGYAFAPPPCHSIRQGSAVTFQYKNDLVTRLSYGDVEKFVWELVITTEKYLGCQCSHEHEMRDFGFLSKGVTTILGKAHSNPMWNVSIFEQVKCHAPWNYHHAIRCIAEYFQENQ